MRRATLLQNRAWPATLADGTSITSDEDTTRRANRDGPLPTSADGVLSGGKAVCLCKAYSHTSTFDIGSASHQPGALVHACSLGIDFAHDRHTYNALTTPAVLLRRHVGGFLAAADLPHRERDRHRTNE